ncbi:MAG: hypothetical protein EGQ87_08045 [Clostridiales bacterium]|nr:hypothetical protein [Clostridiales bacterium]
MSSIRVIGNSWHGYGFRTLRRFFDGEMVFLVSAKLRERVAPQYNVVIKAVCVLNVTFFTELQLF